MKKEFTINVPDEIWVDSWEENKTETWTYEGPEKIWVLINTQTNAVLNHELAKSNELKNDNILEIEINANENPEIAHWFIETGENREIEFVDEINHDGSIHKSPVNLIILDYFIVEYSPLEGLFLSPIIKENKTVNEEKAEKRLAFVKKYDNLYEFDEEIQLKIDETIKRLEDYLKLLEKARPWKYVTLDEKEIPRIPYILVTTFQNLVEIEDLT